MSNREIVMEIVAAFDNNDIEAILNCVDDDIEWKMLGENTITGKENLRQFFADHTDMKMISSTKEHVIIDGDQACVAGTVNCSDGKGNDFYMHYCDIYEIVNGKIKTMITFSVNKK